MLSEFTTGRIDTNSLKLDIVYVHNGAVNQIVLLAKRHNYQSNHATCILGKVAEHLALEYTKYSDCYSQLKKAGVTRVVCVADGFGRTEYDIK